MAGATRRPEIIALALRPLQARLDLFQLSVHALQYQVQA
jgi:hypothetical protein